MLGGFVLLLLLLLFSVLYSGSPRLTWHFLTSYPSRIAEQAGIFSALLGSLFLVFLTALIAVPLGTCAAIYLEEYGRTSSVRRQRLNQIIELNLTNLAAVPSIIYGLLGLAIFVRFLSFGQSLISGALTLTLLILPMIILASREALKSVPQSIREASLALGASRWQTIRSQVLPEAYPRLLSGSILALSRALGETAPLVLVGALAYVTFLPEDLSSPYSALPVQVFSWTLRSQEGFQSNAAAAIIALLVLVFLLNGFSFWLGKCLRRKAK